MSEKVDFYENGSMKLNLSQDDRYVMTKWYKSSVAIFNEKDFRKYLNGLDTKYQTNGNGRSVIRYFLSAALTLVCKNGEGWSFPDTLREYALPDGGDLYMFERPEEYRGFPDIPLILLAAQGNVGAAVKMTEKMHRE